MPHPLSDPVAERAGDPGTSADAGVAPPEQGQTVIVLQGGGALGAYQAGVFEGLAAGGIVPDWLIGTSIGALNAALIAGNAPADRVPRLRAFWTRVGHPLAGALAGTAFGRAAAEAVIVAGGVPGFFAPNPKAGFGSDHRHGAEAASYYSLAPLAETLAEFVDFDRLNGGPVRLTVGAANLRSGEMRYFDSRDERLDVRHLLASCALPPAFPAVRIGGELFWDGGILSNTPVEAVFDDNPRRSGLVFAVHMWNPDGPEPDTLAKVAAREKDLRFSSRAINHIARQRQIHKLRHVIAELAKRVPDGPEVKALTAYGCLTRMHVVRLLAPTIGSETHAKDIDFTAAGITARWAHGAAHAADVVARAPWRAPSDPLEGFILHEAPAAPM